ncbi:DUF1499 domain-containing protein [Oryzomonas japonica]|uniref:DUF1499 domain-containing protein n=2 Tax=Oryzomonas japonica TaxID=2603858 RepID=A0A7J4ZRL9_9BACT|nr:DUF1499 domain-containing protein [Oryzomonas japonica]
MRFGICRLPGKRPASFRAVTRGMIMGILSGLLAACTGERPTNLGMRDGRLTACPTSPNCVLSQADDERHRIAPLSFTGEPDAAFARLKQLLARRTDATVIEERPGYLRAELRTTLFTDDAEFLLDRERRCIQIRSASRLGYSDLGKNRRRMEEIREAFRIMPTSAF